MFYMIYSIELLLLSWIAKRDATRACGDYAEEIALSKQIKRQVRIEIAKLLHESIAKGDWSSIKLARGKSKRQLVSLRDDQSNIVSNEHSAEIFAAYFERVHWSVKPTTIVHDDLFARSHAVDVKCNQVTFV